MLPEHPRQRSSRRDRPGPRVDEGVRPIEDELDRVAAARADQPVAREVREDHERRSGDGRDLQEVAGEPDPASLCEIEGDVAKYMPPFVARPTSDWIELAAVEVHLSAGGNADPLSPQSIDNSTRRVLYSTAQIQAQLIASCCEM